MDTVTTAETALVTVEGLALTSTTWQERGKQPLADVVKATLAAAGRSEHTRRAYLTAAGQFLAWLDKDLGDSLPDDWRPLAESHKVDRQTVWEFGTTPAAVLWLIKPATLDTWRLVLEANGATANTASVRVYAVRTLLSVAYRDGIIPSDQAQRLGISPYRTRQTRDTKPVGRRLSVKEVRRLRGAVDTDTAKGKRDLAMLDLMLFIGLRRSEVAGLRLSNFVQDGGRWWAVVEGKGSKTRRLKVPDPLYKSLTAWFDVAGLYWHDDRAAFYSVNRGDVVSDKPIAPNDVGRLVAAVGARAAIAPATGAGRLGAHDLRRTCARNAHDNGAPLLKVQMLLGHANPETTARYIGLGDDDADTGTDYVRY